MVIYDTGCKENDGVELTQTRNGIHICKVDVPHRTLEERLIAFYGKPINQVLRVEQEEVDWGKAKGGEVW